MVFQGYGLFPHMNVRQNVAYGLKLRKLAKAEIDARVAQILSLVRLEKLAERMSGELSGGQQQRVAVARALVMEPPVLLLDEPFAALDLKLRHAMQDELKRIHREVGGTFVFVTHDQSEALALANRVAVMNEGAMEQIGTPEDVYLRPASRFVAGFVGEANVLAGERRAGRITTQSGLTFDDDGADEAVVLVVRPEHMRLNGEPGPGEGSLPGVIEDVTFFGSHVRYAIKLASEERIRVHRPVNSAALAVGAAVVVSWPYAAVQPIGQGRT